MLNRISGIVATLCALLALAAPTVWAQAPTLTQTQPRVTAMYTTWDSYYFYAGFQVSDHNVVSLNHTPNSQPQEDDDIEVFFDTKHSDATVRTPFTYQMAVSAGNGAYFSVGDGTSIPKAELVYTYKYAAIVDGKLNHPDGTDTGYSIELAIPWTELGLSGPPVDGTTWGFNVISRDRTSLTMPATKFYSLSPRVTSGADVQDPADWSQITFTASGEAPSESIDHVYCPHTLLGRYPTIDGEVLSGKWPSSSFLSFGTKVIHAPAPTIAQEPNTKRSPFSSLPPAKALFPPANSVPVHRPGAAPGPIAQQAPPDVIALPGGGSIKIVPGGIKHPEGFGPPPQQKIASANLDTNPLAPNIPLKYQEAYEGPDADNDIAPPLGPAVAPRLIMAIYRLDYNGDARKAPQQGVWETDGQSALVDQPINGCGPWFSGLRPWWHEQQLSSMRHAGVDVALLQMNPSDPLLGRELDALVEALKEMQAAHKDYPLLGLSPQAQGSIRAAAAWRLHVPEEFRADITPADTANAVIVTPGGLHSGSAQARDNGKAYVASWQAALSHTHENVIIHSWNDYTRGTEIAPSRQYGDSYGDDTRLQSIAFNGTAQWHAKYLKEYVPRTILTDTLYQVPVRIENAGTLPWRAGEGYSLCVRWYDKNGILATDKAPRIPIGQAVLPGQTVTLSLGVAARNGYGGNLKPGDYTLVIDMVQGQYEWFTFAGDHPLQIPVHVEAVNNPLVQPLATFIGTTTPTSGASGETLPCEVTVRNDGPKAWPQGEGRSDYSLLCKIYSVSPEGALTWVGQNKGHWLSPVSVLPGEIARPHTVVSLIDAHGHPLPPGEYELHWLVETNHGLALPGRYDESIDVTHTDSGVSFVLSDIPRQVKAGQTATAKLALQNLSGQTWAENGPEIGYHWYYLDGSEKQWAGGLLTPLNQAIAPGQTDDTLAAKFRVPAEPGRYSLTWDLLEPGGRWASTESASKGDDLMQTIITVTGSGRDIPVDLHSYFNASSSDFNGTGAGFPKTMLPPDGTAEIVANPLEMVDMLGLKPGPPLYPDGYYSSDADHNLPFLYPETGSGKGMVTCQGQTIRLPEGRYHAIHLLAAASGTSRPVPASFGIGGIGQTVTVAPWTSVPSDAVIAYRSPFETTSNGLVQKPVMLGDYVLKANPAQRMDSVTLPDAPSIKILAITLQK